MKSTFCENNLKLKEFQPKIKNLLIYKQKFKNTKKLKMKS